MNDPLIVGIGEILWDVLPEGKKLGGAPSNFAYHVSQLGLASCVASAIGGDALGQEAAGTLDGKRITHLLQRVDFPTGTVQVELDARGVPRYDIRTGVAWDNIPYPFLKRRSPGFSTGCPTTAIATGYSISTSGRTFIRRK